MRAYHRINRACDWLGRRRSVVLVSPYARNIGNCAEELYYGLLLARSLDQPAVFLAGVPLFWKLRLELANRELFEVASPYRRCWPQGWTRLAEAALTLLFVLLRNYHLRGQRWWHALRGVCGFSDNGFVPIIGYVTPTIGRVRLWQPDGVRSFSWDGVAACRWPERYAGPLHVELRAERQRLAERLREEMGLPQDAWYACLHVREGGFRGDQHSGRSASIANYLDGIKTITDAGGFVVRLGDASMTPLPPMERVIEYPHTRFKSELMDVYLISHCRFFVGTNSGPLDVAWLFERPVVLANVTEWMLTYPKRTGDRAILKHVFSRSRGRFLSLGELLAEPFGCQYLNRHGHDYLFVENTAEEIRELIAEYLRAPGGAAIRAAGRLQRREARADQGMAGRRESPLRR